MTTKREVPLTGDTLAWVHNELAELKSRLAIVQQAAEQSRALATDAADKANQSRTAITQFDGLDVAISHVQDDVRATREQIVRAQDDIHSLRQSREEIERRAGADAERIRQDKNDTGKRFGDLERQIEGWEERFASAEEHNRRNLESISQVALRLEAMEAHYGDNDTLISRAQTTVSRMDQELQHVAAAIVALQREDDAHRERVTSSVEAIRRVEGEVEGIRAETNKISRLDDRLELVQAERTRHNERLNDLTAELAKLDNAFNEQHERIALVEIHMSNQQDDLRRMKEQLQVDRDAISAHLHNLNELDAEMRKRQITALEKDIRDLRSRSLNFGED